MMDIRDAQQEDLAQLLELYAQLHGNAMPLFDDALERVWSGILGDANHHILVGVVEERLVSSCVLAIIPNLTRNQRPYALVENVITHESHRNRGYATQLLHFAKELAARRGCYKIMLMTGSKQEATLRFYENAGYNRTDKTAFIQWLEPV